MRALLLLLCCWTGALSLPAMPLPSIAGLAKQEHLWALLTLTDACNLTQTLEMNQGPFTVFAPNDQAIQDNFNPMYASQLEKNLTLLAQTIKYHVVPGTFMAADIKNGQSLKTLEGSPLTVGINTLGSETVVTINGAKVLKTDLHATNGVVHVIDTFIYPIPVYDIPGLLAANQRTFGTLLSLVQKAGLADTLKGGPYTLFAPNDLAFKLVPKEIMDKLASNPALLKRVLLYHVLNGARFSSSLPQGAPGWIQTLEGDDVVILAQDNFGYSQVVINDCPGQTTNAVTNGVFFELNCVLLPPNVM